MTDAVLAVSAATAVGLLLCAAMLWRRAKRTNDGLLRALAVAFVLLAITRVGGIASGGADASGRIFLPRLLGLLIIVREILQLKLAR